MTVSSVTNRKTFAGNSVTTSFATSPVVFFDTSDLVLTVVTDSTGASEVLVENTDYTVTGGAGTTGTVSLAGGSSPYGAPAAGTTLVIRRVLPLTQDDDFLNNDINDAEVLEDRLDRLVMVSQQQFEEAGRALKVPSSEGEQTDITVTGKAGYYLRRNVAGNAFELAVGDANTSTFTQSGTGAVERSVTAKLGEIVSVKDFGAVGDGVTNDKAAITSAFAASKSVRFPSGTYNVGSVSAAENIFGSIDGGGGLVSIETDGSVKFICNTTDNSIPTFFNISNAVRVTVGNVAFEDSGYDNSVTWKGAAGIRLTASTGSPIKDVNIGSIYAKKMVNPFVVTGTTTTRATGIRIGAMYLDDCYYGPNLQNNGDDCVIGAIYATGVLRSAFVYGVTGFKAKIYSNSNLTASADCLISAYDTGYDTKDVSIQYTCRSPANATTLIGVQIFGEGSRTISNVNIDLDVISATGADLVSMRAYNTAGTVENTGATTNLWTGIKVRFVGSTAGANLLAIYCQPNTKGSINICEGIPFNKMLGITELFTFANSPTGTFTPTVVGSGTAGVGTYSTQTGRFTLIGNRVFFDINLTWSAHTGVGPFMSLAGLPVKANASALYPALNFVYSSLAVGAGKELGGTVNPNDTTITLYSMDQAGGGVSQLAFDSAATFYISGNYEVA
jgi:hypothetical protein